MTPAARFSPAIEVFADIDLPRRPASDALKDWGLMHRFAGSSDRASIASLVYDALRRRASARWLMESDAARRIELAPPHVQADVPEWMWPRFEAAFGDRAVAEGRALAGRAPLDLRTNTLKATRDKVLAEL